MKSSSSASISKRSKRPFQTCNVCGCATSYSFYGAVTCDPCRTFFRRQVLSSRVLKCSNTLANGTKCVVTSKSRRECGKCRFEKCLAAGMKPYLVTAEQQQNNRSHNGNNVEQHKNNKKTNHHHNHHKRMNSVISSPVSSSMSTISSLSPVSKYDDEISSIIVSSSSNPSFLNSPPSSLDYLNRNHVGNHGIDYNNNNNDDEFVDNVDLMTSILPSPPMSTTTMKSNNDYHRLVISSPVRKSIKFVLHDGSPFRIIEFFDIPHIRCGVTLEGPSFMVPTEEKGIVTSTRYQTQVFYSSNDDSPRLALKKNGVTDVIMSKLNDEEMFRMIETANLYPIFDNFPHLKYYPIPSSPSSNSDTSFFNIEYSMESTVSIPLNFVIPSFQALPLKDRVLLVRDCVVELCTLHNAKRCDRPSKSVYRPCLDGLATFVISVECSSPHDIYQQVYKYSEDFDEHLRQDDMIVHLMSFICLFKDREGLYDRESVRRERLMYLTLLSKYIEAKYCNLDKSTQDSFVQKVLYKVAQVGYIKTTYESIPLDVDDNVVRMMLSTSSTSPSSVSVSS